jgi:hypothetical protein
MSASLPFSRTVNPRAYGCGRVPAEGAWRRRNMAWEALITLVGLAVIVFGVLLAVSSLER